MEPRVYSREHQTDSPKFKDSINKTILPNLRYRKLFSGNIFSLKDTFFAGYCPFSRVWPVTSSNFFHDEELFVHCVEAFGR